MLGAIHDDDEGLVCVKWSAVERAKFAMWRRRTRRTRSGTRQMTCVGGCCRAQSGSGGGGARGCWSEEQQGAGKTNKNTQSVSFDGVGGA